MTEHKMLQKSIDEKRDSFLENALPFVATEGWSNALIHQVSAELGVDHDYFMALFPGGLEDLVAQFSDVLDRRMIESLADQKNKKMRVRDKIEAAVLERFAVAEPYKDASRLALAYWSVPPRTLRAARVVWRTADRMWDFAGDTATDYNRYTKRGLLSGVITSTTLVWIKDVTDDYAMTRSFLSNRIDNVLELGQALGKIKPR